MRTILLTTILIATALSGCLADPEGKSTTTTTDASDATSTDSTNSTSSPTTTDAPNGTTSTSASAGENTPPTANLTADLENGTAPLNVTFTIDGSDEDGDELSWTLDADGDGTEDYNGTGVPTALVHEFTEPGNFTALLTVSDGTDDATSEFMVAVEAPAAAGPNICHRPTAATGPVYVHSEGGDWVFEETNDIPGLQVENNHPVGDPFWINDAWIGCVQGDQMIN